MEVSERIKTVARQVSGESLADIGTDHGYIPILAVQEGRVTRAAACDINKGPLSRACENIARYGLSAQIETRLGSGLEPVRPGEADCISIAGMGGKLIIDILREGMAVACGSRLVLQPQLDVPEVRRFLHGAGFKIVDEQMLLEDKFYTVITCVPGQDEPYSESDYLLGRLLIDKKDDVLRKFVLKEFRTCEKIMLSVPKELPRGLELSAKMKILERVLECL